MSALGVLEGVAKPTIRPAGDLPVEADLLDNISASFNQGVTGGRSVSELALMREQSEKRYNAYQNITGRNLNKDYGLSDPDAPRVGGFELDEARLDADILKFRETDERFNEILTTAEMQEAAVNVAKTDYENLQRAQEGSNFIESFVGGIIGGTGAAALDPIQAPLFLIGAGAVNTAKTGALQVAKEIGRVAAIEGAIGGASEGAIAVATEEWVERYTGEEQTIRDVLARVVNGALIGGAFGAGVTGVSFGVKKLQKGNVLDDADLANLADAAPTVEAQEDFTVLSRKQTFNQNIPTNGKEPTLKQVAEHNSNVELAIQQFERGEPINIPESDNLFFPDFINNQQSVIDDLQGLNASITTDDFNLIADLDNLETLQEYALINDLETPQQIEKALPELVQKGFFSEQPTVEQAKAAIESETPVYNRPIETIQRARDFKRQLKQNGVDVDSYTAKELPRAIQDRVASLESDLAQDVGAASFVNELPEDAVIDDLVFKPKTLAEQQQAIADAADPKIRENIAVDIERLLGTSPDMSIPLYDNSDVTVKKLIADIKAQQNILNDLATCGVA